MYTEHDEGKGLVKTHWANVRKRVKAVNPEFAALVDEISPPKSMHLYLAYYDYGKLKGDIQSAFLPTADGSSYYRLKKGETSQALLDDFEYCITGSVPFGLLLEKKMELFIDLPQLNLTMPYIIYKPGDFFPVSQILNSNSKKRYAPNGLLSCSSGLHSAFMLPKIGCESTHQYLRAKYKIQPPAPHSMYKHSEVFSALMQSPVNESTWRSCMLYFPKAWFEKMKNDPAWMKIKLYILNKGWSDNDYHRTRFQYETIFSAIEKTGQITPDPFLADVMQHLLGIAMGDEVGYVPSTNEEGLPLHTLQKMYVETYKLNKYYPTIFEPSYFDLDKDTLPIYDSLQYPSTMVFSQPTVEERRMIGKLYELEYIVTRYRDGILKSRICENTIMKKALESIEFHFFHNRAGEKHNWTLNPSLMPEFDERLLKENHAHYDKKATFAQDAPFVRGCISISKKKN